MKIKLSIKLSIECIKRFYYLTDITNLSSEITCRCDSPSEESYTYFFQATEKSSLPVNHYLYPSLLKLGWLLLFGGRGFGTGVVEVRTTPIKQT